MKLKFENGFRACLVALGLLLVWTIWSSAQTPAAGASDTNAAATQSAAGAARAGQGDALRQQVKEHQDYLTFGLDGVAFLKQHRFLGQPMWKYLASLIYILIAFYTSRLLDFLAGVWLRRWSARTGTNLSFLVTGLVRGPVRAVAFVVFLNIGLDLLDWGAVAQGYLSKGFILVVAVSLTYIALRLVDLSVGLWRQRAAAGADQAFDDQLIPVISKTLKVFTVLVAVLVTASNLHINITGALASLSVGALAVGLAAQDTLANLFGAIAVCIDKPFRIGDQIRLEGVEGTVESIGLRSTRVRSLDGDHVTIPNKTVGNATITNISRRQSIKTEMNFGLPRDLPAERVRRALTLIEETYRPHPMTSELTVFFNKFANASPNVQVIHRWKGTDAAAQSAAMQELNLKLKERLDGEGIALALPAQTVYVKQN
jgi:MscS family membrane protein